MVISISQSIILKKTLRVFIPVFVLIIATVVIIVAVYERMENKVYREVENSVIDTKLDNIQAEVTHVTNDLKILALNSQMEKLWERSNNLEVIKSLSSDFLNVAVCQKLYDQIRLIDKSGMEIIRVNYNAGKPKIVAKENLQDKKDRYYFSDAIKLNKKEFFISPLDLNIERGEIEQPLKPMIRIATPLFDKQGKKQGIVLLNYFGQTILNQLVEKKTPLLDRQIMLLNSDGYWLKASSPKLEWGFMYKDRKDITFANLYPEVWNEIQGKEYSQFETEKGLFTSKIVRVFDDTHVYSSGLGNAFESSKTQLKAHDYYWIIVSYVSSEKLYAKRNIYREYASIFLGLLLVSLFFVFWRLVKAQYLKEIAEQTLKDSEEKYRVIVENATDWIWQIDADGKYTYSSSKIFSILGYTSKEIIGKTPFDFMPESEKIRMLKIFSILIKQENSIDKLENINTHKNGGLITLETSAMPFFDLTGKLLGYRGIDRDVTEKKANEKEIQKQNEQLIELNATKDKFFSIIAHDLKSPLSAMLVFSELLVDDFNKFNVKKQKKFIGVLNESVKNTVSLLDNLLLWSQEQQGYLRFNPIRVNLYEIFANTIETLSHLAANKFTTIISKISQDIFVKADINMLLTVFRNLTSNAIKFTPKGGEVIIDACSVTDENKQKLIEIRVVDNGVGIESEKIFNLFKITENTSKVGTENERGTGLGLILCKDFVEKHGGTIRVESKLGKGSSFIFTLQEIEKN